MPLTARRSLEVVAACAAVVVLAVATSDDAPLGLGPALALVVVGAGVAWAVADRRVAAARDAARRILPALALGGAFVTVLAVVPDDATGRAVRLAIVGTTALVVVIFAAAVAMAAWYLARALARR